MEATYLHTFFSPLLESFSENTIVFSSQYNYFISKTWQNWALSTWGLKNGRGGAAGYKRERQLS